jgi:hypothetical protein
MARTWSGRGPIETHGAAPDRAAPVVDVGIGLQQCIEATGDVAGGVDRGVLRQLQVDQQLRPVRGREELLRHEAPAEHRGSRQNAA